MNTKKNPGVSNCGLGDGAGASGSPQPARTTTRQGVAAATPYRATLFAAFLILTMVVRGADRSAQWKEVADAASKGLPQTAVQRLEPILRDAMKERKYAEATKALALKISYEGLVQGQKPEEKILRLQPEIARAPKEMAPMLETILAQWYWQYFQQNRWRFTRRTATAQASSTNFTTWDLPRIFAEIDKHFSAALAAPAELKRQRVSDWDMLLEKGSMPDNYRPTVYDFIAHQALTFYQSGEQAGAQPEELFEIDDDSPILGTVEEFLAWKLPAAQGAERPTEAAAVTLLQDLLRFHRNDPDQTAFAAADLDRLEFGDNSAVGENKTSRYTSALSAFVNRWADQEISAQALYQWAMTLNGEGDPAKAHELATRGTRLYPNSVGGKMCRNLVATIEQKTATITTERVWNAPKPKIAFTYRNVTNAYVRAVAWNWDEFLERRHSRPENLNDAERQALLAKPPTAEYSFKLPATPDFKERTEQMEAPDLKPGFYFLIASHDPSFSDKDNQVTFTTAWVSDLALITRTGNGEISGFVLQARTGEPIAGADVDAWQLASDGNRVAAPAMRTDENGFFSFAAQQRPYLLRARHQDQQLGTLNDLYSYRSDSRDARRSMQTIFFVDRALYRPGQTVQYKGICVQSDLKASTYTAIARKTVTVVFNDPNGKEVARQTHRCNDFGSFSGSFTAPRDRLMGQMTLHVLGDAPGNAYFSVEEYKRPKFQVTVAAPSIAAKLNEKVSVTAKAESYTGAAIDDATVRWRVVREVRWPFWWHWFSWRHPGGTPSREIAHGVDRTGTDGSVKIEFTAQPDRSIAPTNEPIFVYSVHADVTDSAGETRSGERQVRAGYTALQAALTADTWQTDDKPVAIKLVTTSLDDEPQTAEGSVKIYKLQQPSAIERPSLPQPYGRYSSQPFNDDRSTANWALGEVVKELGFTTDAKGEFTANVPLPAGVYRAVVETQDRFGKRVTSFLPLQVLRPEATRLEVKIPFLFTQKSASVEPGEEFTAVWGSGYDTARAFVEIEHRQKFIERYWTQPGRTQQQIKRAIDESLRGGFTVHVTQVRDNRAYLESLRVAVPWSNKDLDVKWEHFTSKLEPGQKETWTAVISGPKAQRAVAEMAATLYDASLDAYRPHAWQQRFNVFYQDYSTIRSQFENSEMQFQYLRGSWDMFSVGVDIRYRTFPQEILSGGHYMLEDRFNSLQGRPQDRMRGMVPVSAPAPMVMEPEAISTKALGGFAGTAKARRADFAMKDADARPEPTGAAKSPDLSQVSARKNLNESAFFFPQLVSDSNGVVRLQFSMPEALTKWRLFAFAHDSALRSGFLEATAVTAKDLMVQPNPPRFVREGDVIEFTVKVSNQSAARQQGTVRLAFAEAATEQSADKALANSRPEQSFDIPAKESRSFSWRIKVPEGLGFLTYKAVASSGRISDGEQGFLPVLSRGIFVTESLPLPIRGPGQKKFEFTKLVKSGRSDTLRHQSLTVQMVSNPSWYAVLALPYLIEFPHECTEQTFNRFYANTLARHIGRSDPKIEKIFEQWRNTPALDSPLEKNQDLKSVLIEETPWLRQAQSESQARRNVGILFDANRLDSETQRLIQQLGDAQLPDGLWPWFPGGRGNEYITLYIVTGFGRLRHLGVDTQVNPAVRALDKLDAWIDEQYREIVRRGTKDLNHLSPTISLYLYARSFYLKDRAIDPTRKEAVDYFLGQARTHWLKVGNRQSEGHLALALARFGDKPSALGITRSLKERSVTDDELGRFWRDTELSWWWYRAPIETQALMVEAFDEVAGDAAAVEECKAWLLKQKQTQDWKTTKATADAVYALLLRGGNWLSSDALVEVQLGGSTIKPGAGTRTAQRGDAQAKPVEAGTGFYEARFQRGEIKPKLGEVTVKKTDPGIAWGSVHWQYIEDVGKITAHTGTPLKLAKSLYTKSNTPRGPVLQQVKGPVAVGDELVVSIELRVDRDMEYVHMKDQRGSGTEPVNVLSQYNYQDGLAYYESTRDTATHFFIDYLPKGVYVFEYSTRVQLRGEYQSGLTEIQCMYAPEFNSHSASVPIVVK